MSHKEHETDKAYIKAPRPRFIAKGISGTSLSGGVISGKERNPQLYGRAWVDACEEMLRTDPVVMRSWSMLKGTLLSASWYFEPGIKDNPASEEYARYANEAFGFDGYSGQMSKSFEEQLSYLWDFIPLGYRYAEEIYRVGLDGEGRQRIWLDHYADREPSAHLKWLSRDNEHLDGVMQQSINIKHQPEPIPSNKLLLLTLNQTGSNFEGVGLMRACYFWWRQKQRTANLMSIGVDRWAVPTPKVVIDRAEADAQGLSQADLSEIIDEAEQQVAAFLSAEQSYLVESPVVKFESYSESPTLYSQGPIGVIQLANQEISQATLTQFINLGTTDTGSRAVGEVHENVFRRSCINLCDRLASQISGRARAGGGTMARLIRFNYGAVDPSLLPRLRHENLDSDELAESMGQLAPLVQSGLLTPTDEIERSIRARIGAGDLPEEAQRSAFERAASGGPSAAALAERLIQRRKRNG